MSACTPTHIHNRANHTPNSNNTMVGFGKYTHNFSPRLKDTPRYRKGGKGPDPLVLFTKEANRNYARNADRLRDMRFARSNEFDRDGAVKARRDSKMTQMAYMNARDPRQLAGLHARVVARGTRAMGAESDGKTYMSVKKQFGIKRPRNAPAVAVRAPAPVVNVNVPNVPQARGAHNPAPPAQAPVAQGLTGRHRGPVAASTLTTPPRARFSQLGAAAAVVAAAVAVAVATAAAAKPRAIPARRSSARKNRNQARSWI